MENELKDKILKAQDKIIYFGYNSLDEVMYADRIDEELDILYTKFNDEFLEKNLDIISELKTSNLLYLIDSNNELLVEKAKQTIMYRIEKDKKHFFSGENVRFDIYGMTVDLWRSAFNKMDGEQQELIKNDINRQLEELKESDPYAYEIINKAGYITSIDNFFSVYELGILTPDKLSVLDKLSIENPNIIDSINYKIFEDSIFEMGEEFISRIAKYPNISKKVIMISENNPELFEIIKKGFSNIEKEKSLPETLEIQRAVITYAAKNYDKINSEIKFEDLANCAFRETDFFKKEHENFLDYDTEFYKKCDEEYKKLSNSYLSLKLRGETLNKKNILLMKFFGIDRNKAEDFCNRYGKDISSINEIDSEAKEYLVKVQEILKLKTEDEIDKVYNSTLNKITPLKANHYKDIFREEYAKTYVDVLNKTDDKLKKESQKEFIDIAGKKVKKIYLKDDFNLLVHSTDSGFKCEKKLMDNFVKTWKEIEDTERHLASCCYITQDFLGCIPSNENGVIAVFTTPETDDINLMGPTDIDSNIKSFSFTSNKGLYMSAQNMPYNSRKVYNEVPIERKNPDYILIFDDTPEKVVQNSYKAAADFDIPVIYIDKKEVEKNQLKKLDDLSNKFQKTKDLDILSELLATYETNVSGWLLNRDTSEKDDSFTKNINHECFRDDFEKIEKRIYEMLTVYIDESIKIGNTSEINRIISILQNESDKYDLIDIKKAPISKTKMKFDSQMILNEIKEKFPEVDDKYEKKENNIQKTSIDINKIAKEIAQDNSIMKSEVDYIDEFLEKSLNLQKEVGAYEE